MKTTWKCTTITLIPKILASTQVKDYRPIAYCTTLYKIVAKILTNRLKKVIEVIIGKAQSIFIEGRNIIENIRFCHEPFKGYNRKVSYSLVFDGGLTKPFQAKRGIRKGDLMSPYIFVIAMEYLQMEMNQLPTIKEFKYHPRCKRLVVTHIYFANDLPMFCNADINSLTIMKETIQSFSGAFVLQVNAEKSSIYIAGVHKDLKDTLISLLGYAEGALPFKYLGVPLFGKKLNI
uniref:Uncharacterized protein LOC104212333 n=1 Tax=Nicotiana sylvestris TaxID=4096 RepID=A0A1U7UUY8_NICSY|nr:PREDICTED: uncharacterized protein LOC104212333 [Nicotiana sylvestris]